MDHAAPSSSQALTGSLCRRSSRYAFASQVLGYAALFLEGDVYAVKVDNLSPEGIGLIVNEPLPSGGTGTARVFSFVWERSYTWPLRIVHSTPLEEGGYLVGCEFTTPMEPRRFSLLLLGLGHGESSPSGWPGRGDATR